jgi:rubrerythrin
MSQIIEKVEDYVSSSSISHEMLLNKLSEFLAVEKGGVKLYETALQIVQDSEVSAKLSEFLDQTRKHETILIRLIRDLGGDPEWMSPGARLAEQKAQALLSTMTHPDGLSGGAVEINALENIVLAETKDHADWEMIGKIARRSDDAKVRDVLKPAVNEVEPEENEHLSWAKTQLARLEFKALSR